MMLFRISQLEAGQKKSLSLVVLLSEVGAGKQEGKCHVREDEWGRGRRRMEGGGKR